MAHEIDEGWPLSLWSSQLQFATLLFSPKLSPEFLNGSRMPLSAHLTIAFRADVDYSSVCCPDGMCYSGEAPVMNSALFLVHFHQPSAVFNRYPLEVFEDSFLEHQLHLNVVQILESNRNQLRCHHITRILDIKSVLKQERRDMLRHVFSARIESTIAST
jgi:hypothetical protein